MSLLRVPTGVGALSRSDIVSNIAGVIAEKAAVQRQLIAPVVQPGVSHREQVDHVKKVQQFGRDLGMKIEADGIAGPLTYGLTGALQGGMILGPYLAKPLKRDHAPGPMTTAMLDYSRENGFRCALNFKWTEFDTQNPDRVVSKNNPVLVVTRDLVILAQAIRTGLGKGFTPVSAYRDPYWNKIVGGAAESQHMVGKAIDLPTGVVQMSESRARGFGGRGVGVDRASGLVAHVDTRTSIATWYYG